MLIRDLFGYGSLVVIEDRNKIGKFRKELWKLRSEVGSRIHRLSNFVFTTFPFPFISDMYLGTAVQETDSRIVKTQKKVLVPLPGICSWVKRDRCATLVKPQIPVPVDGEMYISDQYYASFSSSFVEGFVDILDRYAEKVSVRGFVLEGLERDVPVIATGIALLFSIISSAVYNSGYLFSLRLNRAYLLAYSRQVDGKGPEYAPVSIYRYWHAEGIPLTFQPSSSWYTFSWYSLMSKSLRDPSGKTLGFGTGSLRFYLWSVSEKYKLIPNIFTRVNEPMVVSSLVAVNPDGKPVAVKTGPDGIVTSALCSLASYSLLHGGVDLKREYERVRKVFGDRYVFIE